MYHHFLDVMRQQITHIIPAVQSLTRLLKLKEKQIVLDTQSSPANITLNLTERTIADEYLLSTKYANHLCVKSSLIVVAW